MGIILVDLVQVLLAMASAVTHVAGGRDGAQDPHTRSVYSQSMFGDKDRQDTVPS